MVLAFESGDHPLDAWMAARSNAAPIMAARPRPRQAAMRIARARPESWRNAFIRMPYAREHLTPAGIIADTFETAITWDRFEAFHDTVKAATERRSATRPAARAR